MSGRLITQRDVDAGRVEPKDIGRGIVIPPALQINCETLREHQRRMYRENRKPLTRGEAGALFSAEEAGEYFGPAGDAAGS